MHTYKQKKILSVPVFWKSLSEQKKWWLYTLFSAVSAYLVGLSYFYPYISCVTMIGFVPFLLMLLYETKVRKAIVVGLLVGTACAIPILSPLFSLEAWTWSDTSLFLFHQPSLAWYSIVIGSMVLLGGGIFALFGTFVVFLHRYTHNVTFILPVLWIFVEFLRSLVISGITWGNMGYILTHVEPLAVWASVGTVYLLSFMVILCNSCIADIIISIQAKKPVLLKIYIYTLIFTMFFVAGIHMQKTSQENRYTGSMLYIDIPYTTKETNRAEVAETIMDTLEATIVGDPEIVVLPENVFPFFKINVETGYPYGFFNEKGRIHGLFQRFLDISENHPETAIILGMHSSNGAGKQYNSLYIYRDGQIVGQYNKHNLLPFGETTVPLLSSGTSKFVSGDETGPLLLDDISIRPFICSEAYHLTNQTSVADVVVHISNETIFHNPLVARYGETMATMRAYEAGAVLVRAAKVLP